MEDIVKRILEMNIRMVIDSEWRSICEKNPVYEDWIIMNFNISGFINQLIDEGYVSNDEVRELANSIRREYNWT